MNAKIRGITTLIPCTVITLLIQVTPFSPSIFAAEPIEVLELPPSPENPRNSEGDFISLRNGKILFVYTRFRDGAKDNSPSDLMSRFSEDGGTTWSREDGLILANEGEENTMSVSLLRLSDGRIALLYLRKNSWRDCRPCIRFSSDEAQTWSEPVEIVPKPEAQYYVVNNDRLLQLRSGRLAVPVAQHTNDREPEFSPKAEVFCYLSDDGGTTWRQGRGSQDGTQADGTRVTLQEPGIVELKDGRLMMFCRTDMGSQYVSYSSDQGETWQPFQASSILSPRSPATIERIPSTGDLLLVWNDHTHVPEDLKNKRTPLSVALSRDGGQTWSAAKTLFDDPSGWYCYTAIHFLDEDTVLLGHCAGNRKENNGLARTQITRLPLEWVYGSPKSGEN